jgi:hypothetical protein
LVGVDVVEGDEGEAGVEEVAEVAEVEAGVEEGVEEVANVAVGFTRTTRRTTSFWRNVFYTAFNLHVII